MRALYTLLIFVILYFDKNITICQLNRQACNDSPINMKKTIFVNPCSNGVL